MEIIHIAIIEYDTVIRESLEGYLGAHPALRFSIVACSVEDFLEKAENRLRVTKPDVLLVDIGKGV